MQDIQLSLTEEDYLKAIFNITEKNRGTASTNDIASSMQTSAAAVTDMVQRMASRKLLDYEKYKGVKLNSVGIAFATQLIRKERLWKVFLHQKLGMDWDKLNDAAEQLKHINTIEVIRKLELFLGSPKYDPHGEPIPNADGRFTLRNQTSLFNLRKTDRAKVVAVRNQSSSFLQFLDDCGISIGSQIEVLQEIDFDLSKRIMINDQTSIVFSSKICQDLYVKQLN